MMNNLIQSFFQTHVTALLDNFMELQLQKKTNLFQGKLIHYQISYLSLKLIKGAHLYFVVRCLMARVIITIV